MTKLSNTGWGGRLGSCLYWREIDRIALGERGPNLYQMMENAGRSLALTVLNMLGLEWAASPIIVLAGRGGNGGGGICAARHPANRGAAVTVVVSDLEASPRGSMPRLVRQPVRTFAVPRLLRWPFPKQVCGSTPAGDLFLADIGIPNEVYRRVGLDVSNEILKERYRVSVRPR